MTTPSFPIARYAIVLGLLTAIGPSAIDMYLPALPRMASDLAADPAAAQASLMAYYLALGAGQLIAGPLSDLHGRKRPLFGGLALFVLASFGCALAPNIEVLVALRLLQGLGASVAMVTPRAVVRDLATGPVAARLMALLLTIYTVSPILAPLVGSGVADLAGWRGVFWVLGGMAVLGIGMVAVALPETRVQPAARTGIRTAFAGYAQLLVDRRFMGLALTASMCLAAFFVFVANSPFVYMGHHGVTPRAYAVLFALNAVALVAVSPFNGRLVARYGVARTLTGASACQAVAATVLSLSMWAGVDRLDVMVVVLMVVFGLNGLIVPNAFVLAMEAHPALAGRASALIGTLNFAGGALVMALVAPFAGASPGAMAVAIVLCAATACGLAWGTLGGGGVKVCR